MKQTKRIYALYIISDWPGESFESQNQTSSEIDKPHLILYFHSVGATAGENETAVEGSGGARRLAGAKFSNS